MAGAPDYDVGNLVDNALRQGSGSVTLSAAARDGWVEVYVLDDGRGFAPDFLPHAFERFTRAGESRTLGGSGLGLSIVDVIARADGGSAGAANREGGGADVWIEVPRQVARRRDRD
jgi:signal transduction histidine kinase